VTVAVDGIVTGWASMMSATVMPSSGSVKAVGATRGPADCAMNQRHPEPDPG